MSILEEPAKKREDSIDLIRAVAIISVLLFHYTARFSDDYLQWQYTGFKFTYGYLGVQLFFILSGYCIYLTITHARSLADFFAKRLSRLWPALIVAATVTFIAIRIFGLPGFGVNTFKYLSNLLFLNVLTDRYVDGAYWSLTIEVKFYLWFGLLYFLDRVHIARNWAWFSLLGMGAAGLAALSDSHALLASAFNFLAQWVLIYPYAVWFLVGIVIYEWEKLSWRQRLLLLAPVGISLLASVIWADKIEALFLAFCVIGCILIIPLKGMSIPAPVRFIGLISYPLYLVHQFIGIIIIRELTGVDPYIRIGVASAVVILIAAIIHYAIEWRFRRRFYKAIYDVFAFALPKFAKEWRA